MANFAIVRVGANGNIDFYNSAGTVHLLADIAGYYSASGGDSYTALAPTRLFDTRSGTGGVAKAAVGAGRSISVKVAGVDGIPAGVDAVALNVTATGATANTYVTAWPDGTTRPGTSTLNPPRGVTVANFAIVRVGANGKSTSTTAPAPSTCSPTSPATTALRVVTATPPWRRPGCLIPARGRAGWPRRPWARAGPSRSRWPEWTASRPEWSWP